ncbi:MAG: hypothetical protein K2P78_13425 [Gemmataceae bacterium]|nr:hypothetical protein [Gemmataceae bacterium]
MARRWSTAVCCGAALLLIGCNKDSGSGKGDPPGQSPAPAVAKSDGEAEAREKLKIGLDSWTFGDTREKWTKDHPDISMLDERWSIRPFEMPQPVKLLKYEIGAGRAEKDEKGNSRYEFAVVLNLSGPTGAEFKRNVTYMVSKMPDGKWFVIGKVA